MKSIVFMMILIMKKNGGNMTIEELKKAQADIENEIIQCAISNGLTTEDIEPIPDGIYDAKKYLSSPKRIMWILKEPIDETCDNKPRGGGWPLYEAFDNDDAWKNRTWQPIIYATYGILNQKKWEDMSWIEDDKSMVEVLKQIAYINISKMPALTSSKDSELIGNYNIWRSIILEQIRVYNPQIIIFGNTFKYLKNDLIGEEVEPTKNIDDVVHIYEKDNVKMFDAYHPNQRIIERECYINSIIENCI